MEIIWQPSEIFLAVLVERIWSALRNKHSQKITKIYAMAGLILYSTLATE